MTKKEIKTLLYTQEAFDVGDYIVGAWFDDLSAENHIEIVVKKTRKEGALLLTARPGIRLKLGFLKF